MLARQQTLSKRDSDSVSGYKILHAKHFTVVHISILLYSIFPNVAFVLFQRFVDSTFCFCKVILCFIYGKYCYFIHCSHQSLSLLFDMFFFFFFVQTGARTWTIQRYACNIIKPCPGLFCFLFLIKDETLTSQFSRNKTETI